MIQRLRKGGTEGEVYLSDENSVSAEDLAKVGHPKNNLLHAGEIQEIIP